MPPPARIPPLWRGLWLLSCRDGAPEEALSGGGGVREVSHAFTCLGFALLPLILLTLRETMERVLSSICQPVASSRVAGRSRLAGDVRGVELVPVFAFTASSLVCGRGVRRCVG